MWLIHTQPSRATTWRAPSHPYRRTSCPNDPSPVRPPPRAHTWHHSIQAGQNSGLTSCRWPQRTRPNAQEARWTVRSHLVVAGRRTSGWGLLIRCMQPQQLGVHRFQVGPCACGGLTWPTFWTAHELSLDHTIMVIRGREEAPGLCQLSSLFLRGRPKLVVPHEIQLSPGRNRSWRQIRRKALRTAVQHHS